MHSYVLRDDAVRRANDILAQMTLGGKIDYIGGHDSMFVRPIERLGVPAIKMSDGPMGCRCYGKATALPAGIALASTWNRELSRKIGVALGRECRARGVHILLAPGVNIYRSPKCGRNFEYMGEDPHLASEMVVPEIEGLQSEGVLATIKHYACNNQEWNRHHISSEVDERTLREIYLPMFEAAIRKADSRCLMIAYNLLNGIHCSEHDYLINHILKGEWEFDGFVMSDWGSVYDGVNAANGGLDIEMPDGKLMSRETLIPAIEDGRVKESTIDDKVVRMLRTFIQAGFFERSQQRDDIPQDDPTSVAVALEVAREALVLLKNDGNALPLDSSKVHSVAVLGPNAHPAIYGAGGSSFTTVFHSTSILEGMRKLAGETVQVRVAEKGLGFAGPLKMDVFGNANLAGEPTHTSQVEKIDNFWALTVPQGAQNGGEFSVRWTGKICPPSAGKYEIVAGARDGFRVFLDDKLILDDWNKPSEWPVHMVVDLGNREYDLRIENFRSVLESYARFAWKPYQTPAEFAEGFSDVDAIVYCAGFNHRIECESYDRFFELPPDQIAEIDALSKLNARLIVVLNSGGGVAWGGWLDNADAVIEAWYSGQEYGLAVAEVVFGEVNPSGKLPVTFEKCYEDNPTADYYNINDNGKTPYTEGIFVGYRGYDKNNTEPQFCFGHGLSYTFFEFSDLRIAENGNSDTRQFSVSCSVTNVGDMAGSEVAQIYVGDVECSVERPIRELKGFYKVSLQPGETNTVNFTLSERDLAFYDVDTRAWVTQNGEFDVWIGSSSRDLPLQGKFVW